MRHRRLTPEPPGRFPGEPRILSKKQGLTRSQERRRIEGLRILAHPELYPDPKGPDGTSPSMNGSDVDDGKAAGMDNENGP